MQAITGPWTLVSSNHFLLLLIYLSDLKSHTVCYHITPHMTTPHMITIITSHHITPHHITSQICKALICLLNISNYIASHHIIPHMTSIITYHHLTIYDGTVTARLTPQVLLNPITLIILLPLTPFI